ncbi:hypothetical protein C2G38_2051468 [Gigaspora rosea]|uniref:C2H2-type domain-containing protein n=2 Tax=Gigaspora TaxID=4873 RepID=A0A397TSB3_9GLOM|nr:hypothetical protein C2G38_2051468 [Gigaspora rosea]
MRWQCKHCNREFSKPNALTQHVLQKHPHLQSSPNQEVSNKQVDDDIWDLPEDYPNYVSSEYGSEYMERSASSVEHEHSFMEAELHQMDNMTQDDASQNTSNVSDIEDHEDISFATESYKIGLEDYEGASFDEAFQDLYHPRTVEWPNDAYHEFMEIINKYQLSNLAGDAFITFFNKFSNLDISLLPPSTKTGKEFLDDTIVPYMMFKEVSVKMFQNVEYVFYYRSLIKTIKSLLMINSINQSLVLQYEDKKEVRNARRIGFTPWAAFAIAYTLFGCNNPGPHGKIFWVSHVFIAWKHSQSPKK